MVLSWVSGGAISTDCPYSKANFNVLNFYPVAEQANVTTPLSSIILKAESTPPCPYIRSVPINRVGVSYYTTATCDSFKTQKLPNYRLR